MNGDKGKLEEDGHRPFVGCGFQRQYLEHNAREKGVHGPPTVVVHAIHHVSVQRLVVLRWDAPSSTGAKSCTDLLRCH